MSELQNLTELARIEAALNKRWPENKIEPTLDRISALVDALGSPQLSYPTIHLAGTNGKTTTSRMIDQLLANLGYRVGRYTSPHPIVTGKQLRQLVTERDNGQCTELMREGSRCPDTGTDVDHIEPGNNHNLDNLS